ncbi:DUF1934 domain-containing protein [Clostridium saccharobutylicum]|uniref:Beta-barrel protein YwiB n=1 Tax=Clostridium saccharobutylicum DSM 13864 TaxID=1345695 RepID=U5MPC0_CLOSA|nr:DUF1934 domain-containing protein [Clostridium saccharobutylicum]AGX41516.1 hypothetical protein CLSA_c04930 [Clostridium saccharobutylicum DSM 13864]AQR88796.1 putative beta-barrel protein YwiB [Clostridium saccharobutylicum]AQR98695.1 putative beta-barrel protein YwiB [Clostridium saccharobutylicum]AQS08417.1 putative beta-barrel protein YwiB [Clostridium saccharobutylicum]AQS12685.1 putative beta-barrel protein YwiB [Clostridium saccharobutylicum]
MGKKAIINVKSSISGDEEDLIEVVTPGKFYKTEEGFKVEYDETKISGMEDTHTIMIIREKSFDLIRIGSTETTMEFKKNHESISLYKTPYGVMEICINTKKLEINMTDDGGTISTFYNLHIEGQQPLKTKLIVDIKAD